MKHLYGPIRRIAAAWKDRIARWGGYPSAAAPGFPAFKREGPYGLVLLQGIGGEVAAVCREGDFHIFVEEDTRGHPADQGRPAFRLLGYPYLLGRRDVLDVPDVGGKPIRIERFRSRTSMRRTFCIEVAIIRVAGAPAYLRTHDGPHSDPHALIVARPHGCVTDAKYAQRLLTDSSYVLPLELSHPAAGPEFSPARAELASSGVSDLR